MKVRVSTLASLFSASLVSMTCCKTSLLMAVLGLGSSGLAVWLAQYRTLLLVITAVLLGFAFYLVYWARNPASEAGNVCYVSKPSMRIDKVLLWLATAIIAGLFLYAYYNSRSARATTAPASPQSPPVQVVEIKVEGMDCIGCRATCEKALAQVPGVSKVLYDERKGHFIVEGEEGKLQVSQLITAIEQTRLPMGGPGYRVSEVRLQNSGGHQ